MLILYFHVLEGCLEVLKSQNFKLLCMLPFLPIRITTCTTVSSWIIKNVLKYIVKNDSALLWVLICTMHLTVCFYHVTDAYAYYVSVWPVWLNCWVFVYELSGRGFESSCSHLNFRFRACFEQGVPWHSINYRVWFTLKPLRDMIRT